MRYRWISITCVCVTLAACADRGQSSTSAADGPTAVTAAAVTNAERSFTLFESGQVRPLALAPDGKHLFAVNTPDNRLEIFKVKDDAGNHVSPLQRKSAVSVGLEPVAVAARTNTEVWVVNHLSDSISIVDVSDQNHPRVVRTLLVGDEPRDIVFAGPNKSRAFITTAHRGQNNPNDPELLTPGVGRADVWVFDANNLGSSLGGAPLTILTLFTDTPRALAVTSDGSTVYAAGFHTGNRTTTIHERVVAANGGLQGPRTNFEGDPQPQTSIIVKYRQSPSDGQMHWLDTTDRIWDAQVRFSLPDKDVFAIDATANPPQPVVSPGGVYTGVGTVLFNMAVNPVSGNVYVSNIDAQNDHRFEGPGIFAGSSVRGHLAESRITILSNGGVAPRHLNKHINYASCCAPIPNDENAKSLAFPQEMAVSSDGTTLYVAALGSSKIGIYDTAALESDTFVPSTANQIAVSGGGPTGVVLDEDGDRLYVMTRFDNAISVIDTSARAEIWHEPIYNPEPPSIVDGRRFLYDASLTSSHGDSACASCHIFGDFDSLAWDLGDPDGTTLTNPNPAAPPTGLLRPGTTDFKPMKGPMTTQSLRGMANHGAMHWRGDRTGGNDAPTAQPNSGSYDENAAFLKFNPAFVGLLGRDQALTAAQMQAFSDFILQITYPPNPIRNLDNSLTADQQAGREHYFSPSVDGPLACNDCHTLNPSANAEFGVRFPGFFGTSGLSTIETADRIIPQTVKVPHFRNLYQKVGEFGTPHVPFGPLALFPSTGFLGDQVRGFGYFHDGSVDSAATFIGNLLFSRTFSANGFPPGPAGQVNIEQVTKFLLAYDSNMAPIVGQQITLTSSNAAVAGPRIDVLIARANAGECDLVVKGGVFDDGYLYDGAGHFLTDRASASSLTDAALRALSSYPHHELTYTCVPPGSGRRIALDADLDGYLDGDERDAGSDPRDPASTP
jgi:DNA-binding beta-propeller fold protein YncE